ncbi:hypothetical protein SAMN05192574_101400 [Mucilaginibacter gossypiicola]|uniref:Uncharacterized protein n=1 Tax=Mucilaginibacter gossypiicola TaxID=551995 RepID=A0A1H8A7Z3_9SPHI|nr:hypothetical protein [Mucilaginibacter gossypiicola]SEM66711.1 hypothetical protein SAMN05192574_101400 [Mucilaginibacter gossypiicola]
MSEYNEKEAQNAREILEMDLKSLLSDENGPNTIVDTLLDLLEHSKIEPMPAQSAAIFRLIRFLNYAQHVQLLTCH